MCILIDKVSIVMIHPIHGLIQRRGTGGPDPPPLKNHKTLGFLSNNVPDPLKNHKATKSEFNVGPSSAGQGNTI